MATRHVVHIGGYHPIDPQQAFTRASWDFSRFCTLWTLSGTLTSEGPACGNAVVWNVSLAGKDWQKHTHYHFFRWDDLIAEERQRHWLSRLPLGLWALMDFMLGGVILRYLATSWRYTLFFLYPLIILAVFAGLSWFVAGFAASGLVRIAVAMALFAAALPVLGNRIYLDHLLDDWIHARQLVRAPAEKVDERLDGLAKELAGAGGELLIVGHSLGAVLAIHLVAKLVDRGFPGKIRFASVGSSILKIGLHRRAARLRQQVAKVAGSGQLIWVDFQALNDVMNFYKSEPVAALGLAAPPAQTSIVRFRAAVAPERYRRLERNFFKLHNQFVGSNDTKSRYDFQMLTLGPFSLEALVRSDDGALSLLDGDGGLTEAGRAALNSHAA